MRPNIGKLALLTVALAGCASGGGLSSETATTSSSSSTRGSTAQGAPAAGAPDCEGLKAVSGIAFYNGKVFAVDDRLEYAGYYCVGTPSNRPKPPGILEVDSWEPVALAGAALATDLEAIDVIYGGLAGTISERLHALVFADGRVWEYPWRFAEVGNRGLEGLAIRELHEGKVFEVAVVWEGGYLKRNDLPTSLAPILAGKSYPPVVVVHRIERSSPDQRVSLLLRDICQIPLEMASLNDWVDKKKQEPEALRFRSPDLIWHDDGFIVLLSSQNGSETEYGPKVLQRFDRDGSPIGRPFDLKLAFKEAGVNDPENLNWEGMDWYKEGSSLVFVQDGETPQIVLIELPEDW